MKNQIVEFLTSDDLQPAANNFYDEVELAAAENYDCDPLTIRKPLADELTDLFQSSQPVSVILTGTAGDGKTSTARNVAQNLSQNNTVW